MQMEHYTADAIISHEKEKTTLTTTCTEAFDVLALSVKKKLHEKQETNSNITVSKLFC